MSSYAFTDHRLKSVPLFMTPTSSITSAKRIEDMLASPSVQVAFDFFDSNSEEITEEQVRICSIPSPPFGEKRRADYFREKFGVDVWNEFRPVYEGLEEKDLLARQNGTISLTRRGLLEVDHFLIDFFEPELRTVRYA